MSAILTIGSVTTAVRLSKLVEKYLTRNVRVIHTPEQISGGGCSYSLKTDMKYAENIAALAKEYNIQVKKIFSETKTGKGVVYHDLSR